MKLYASILGVGIGEMHELMLEAEKARIDGFHFDISDGCFTPNLTFGPWLLRSMRNMLLAPFEAHLMTNNPERYYDELSCCTETIYFHPEASVSPMRDINKIHSLGMEAGIAITNDVHVSTKLLENVDVMLLLLVKPGFPGQSMQQGSLERIDMLREMRDNMKLNFEIAVDGGVKPENAALLVHAGAQRLVSGSGIFGNKKPSDSIMKFREVV
ncbi:MAG: ribulose-phosphate 3-epimerase [Nitrososphaerota archaeon]|nr:ribulose-phosphate 3-epimerase [Nitrososphaerota archaeon]MDG7049046.1 ribulose-phosphate 3-epimerase [Nitrososphaerota archaeon]MDG7052110.1 ribulose-phosphate 3-epimerase [Nitrososphaerota archaeon]